MQEKYFLTFPSFVEALVRVLHSKHRLVLKDNEHLSVVIARFFKSQSFKEAIENTSICYRIKDSLSSKESSDVLDHYRDKLRTLFKKLISE